ncbi:MAG: hypothetical protein KAI53_01280 [Candidatus Aenigmarchaeota archaeon]|nr:hypothetical protein [Candidatus Aenigmarchaeota archaeon]
MMKGFFFTMDALVAITLLSVAFGVVLSIDTNTISGKSNYEQMHYVTEDAMQIFGKLKFSDINETLMNSIISNTNLTTDDTSKSLPDIIGLLWAYNETSYAADIVSDVFSDPGQLIPKNYDYALSVEETDNKTLIYSTTGIDPKNEPELDYLTSASRIVSGYQENTAPFGFVSRAWASKVSKNASKVFEFNPEGGSYDPGGCAYINKKFYLNATEIYNATMHISVHRGTSAINSNSLVVDASGDIIGDVNWLYTQQKFEAGKATNMDFGVVDITDYLNASPGGWHEIEIMLKSQDDFNTHIHPGTKVEVIYGTEEERTFTGNYAKRKYFDNVLSDQSGTKKRGAWAIMPINVPKAATVKNATLHLRALNVFDAAGKEDIQIYFNNNSILNVTAPGATYDAYINLTDYVAANKNTTNVLSVYVNSFENDFWGETDAEIYSDPENDENSSSYVYIEYDWSLENKFQYGYIEVTAIEHFDGIDENPKKFVEDFDNHEITSAYLHVAQIDSENVTVTVEPYDQTKETVFISQRVRALPSTLYIDPTYFNTTRENNTINVSDICLSLKCSVLPQSSLEYNIFIPSQVGYGAMFDTEAEANQDAQDRLNDTLSAYADILDLGIYLKKPITTGNIPWMYGPAFITLEVWKS